MGYMSMTQDLSIAAILQAIRKVDPPDEIQDENQASWLMKAMRFDCRALPLAFVEDTGDAVWGDMEATGERVELPFNICYFEFENELAVLAMNNLGQKMTIELGSADEFDLEEARQRADDAGKLLDQMAEDVGAGKTLDERWAGVFQPKTCVVGYKGWSTNHFQQTYGEFTNKAREVQYHRDGLRLAEPRPYFDEVDNLADAKLTIGVIALLNEKLVTDHHTGARRFINANRQKRGLPPLPSTHVLTVNVPAVRNTTQRSSIGTHESPALHWRRGHWRTLHRGSESEARTWIRRMLVGDPDRGFISKQYRLKTNAIQGYTNEQ